MSDWTLTEDDGIAVWMCARPPRNFMSFAAVSELGERLRELGEGTDVSVVVLTGGLPGYFVAHRRSRRPRARGARRACRGRSAGRDHDARQGRGAAAARRGRHQRSVLGRGLRARPRLCRPRCRSIGDARTAGGRRRHDPGAGGTQRLPRLVGPGRALELVLTARPVAAEEAAAIGLVEVVLPDDGFLEVAIDWARGITSQPRSALVAAKRAVIDGLGLPLSGGPRLEARLFAECLADRATLALQDRIRERYRGTPPDVPVRF